LCALDGAGVTSLCPCLSDLDGFMVTGCFDGFMVTGCFDGLAVLGLLVFLATGADDDRACDAGAFLESFTGCPAKYLAIAVAVGSAMGMVSVTGVAVCAGVCSGVCVCAGVWAGVCVCAGVCMTGRLSGAP
jgi:hypothetical protein